MDKLFAFILLLFVLSGCPLPVKAQNPFMSKDNSRRASQVRGPRNPFLARIAAWQQQLNRKMAILTRQAREKRSPWSLLSLMLLALAYGVLHAAGPGHGKAVATTYLLSAEKRPSRGILLGNLVALFHGLSGVALVLGIHLVLKKAVTDSLQNVTRITQVISYSLIALLGAVLLVKNLLSYRQKVGAQSTGASGRPEVKLRHPLAMAAAVGIIPCPGVVLVMLFCLSLNLTGLGLLLSLLFVLGMAITISAVGVIGLAGKNLALGVLESRTGVLKIVERGIETLSALMITALGSIFLAAVL